MKRGMKLTTVLLVILGLGDLAMVSIKQGVDHRPGLQSGGYRTWRDGQAVAVGHEAPVPRSGESGT